MHPLLQHAVRQDHTLSKVGGVHVDGGHAYVRPRLQTHHHVYAAFGSNCLALCTYMCCLVAWFQLLGVFPPLKKYCKLLETLFKLMNAWE